MPSDLEDGLRSIRDALRTARAGDFSVRLPSDGGGLIAETALAFNALLERNESLANELGRVARSVGVRGDLTDRVSLGPSGGAWAGAVESVNALIDATAFSTLEATDVIERVAAGDLSREMPLRIDGKPTRRRVGSAGHCRELGGGLPSKRVGRGLTRRRRDRHRGSPRRSSRRRRARRDLEGPRRRRQPPLRGPHGASAKHRAGLDGDRGGRPLTQVHGGGAGRDPRGEEHDQRLRRSAPRDGRGGHPGGARGRLRGKARRSGRRARRLRHLAGAHRQRQHARRQPDQSGPQHRAR